MRKLDSPMPPGVGVLILEPGDSITIHQGRVFVYVHEVDDPHYTLTAKDKS